MMHTSSVGPVSSDVIIHELVRRQGGVIWVESVPGKGSAFSFTLPVAEAYKSAEVAA
jgi:signal transduction histidine kinase